MTAAIVGNTAANDSPSSGRRRHFSATEKVALLRRHLLEKTPISQLCEQNIAPSLFYQWQREFFEHGHAAFDSKKDGKIAKQVDDAKDCKIQALEAKLRRKDEVLGELLEEHVALKKKLGDN